MQTISRGHVIPGCVHPSRIGSHSAIALRSRGVLAFALSAPWSGPPPAAFGTNLETAQSYTPVRPPHGIKAVVFDAYGTLFDVRSVARLAEERFPGHGAALTETWRGKQLECSWLVSLMERYEDFRSLTERGLRFACRTLGLQDDESKRARLMDEYLRLVAFDDVEPAFARLGSSPRRFSQTVRRSSRMPKNPHGPLRTF